MTEDFIRLNVHEIGILLSALELLDVSEEKYIAKYYGSVPALHEKLHKIWHQMDISQIDLQNDIAPSF